MKLVDVAIVFMPLILLLVLAIIQFLNIIKIKDRQNAIEARDKTFGENVNYIRTELQHLEDKVSYLQKTLDNKKDTSKDKWRDKRDPVTGRLRV